MATNNNITGSYCLLSLKKRHTCHITSSLLQGVLMSASSTNASALTLVPLSNSTFNPCDSQRPNRCWCVFSVRRRPRSWYYRTILTWANKWFT